MSLQGKFAPQIHVAMQSLRHKIKEQSRRCAAISWIHSFRDRTIERKKIFFLLQLFKIFGTNFFPLEIYMTIRTTFVNTIILQDNTFKVAFSSDF